MALGAAFGYLSYSADRQADRAFARFRDARSRETAESSQAKVEAMERDSMVYGILGGLGVAGAGGFLVFSF